MGHLEVRAAGDRCGARWALRRRRAWAFGCGEILERRIAPTASLSIADPVPLPEGDYGTKEMMFVVTRSGDVTAPQTVDYSTQDGTARAGVDYVPEAGTLSFAANQTMATIAAPIIGNTIVQGNRTFAVNLFDVIQGIVPASFTSPQSFVTGNSPFSVATGDINGDGRPDVVVTNNGSGTVSVLLNTTAPGAAAPSFATQYMFIFPAGTRPVSLAIGDVNGDGRPDLVTASFSAVDQETVWILLNSAPPSLAAVSFSPPQPIAIGNGYAPRSVTLDDINGDGRPTSPSPTTSTTPCRCC